MKTCGCNCNCHEDEGPNWPGPCAGCCEPGDDCACGSALRVLNITDYRRGWPPNAVYVGRGTPWGNPYSVVIGRRDRAEAIALYRAYAIQRLLRNPAWLEPLKGKLLLCHCAPLACHAAVLIELGA